MISHIDQKFIDSRRAQLHDFLIKMSYVPGVLQSDTFLQWCGLAERDSGYALATEASAARRRPLKLQVLPASCIVSTWVLARRMGSR